MKQQHQDILKVLKDRKRELFDKYHITRLGLFGSVARDEATEASDVDIVVEMPPDLFLRVHLKEDLEAALHSPVDVIRYRKQMNNFLKPLMPR
ncbi:MAG: nucleotidyltransferase domain-containing protein [Sedimenticola sp.]